MSEFEGWFNMSSRNMLMLTNSFKGQKEEGFMCSNGINQNIRKFFVFMHLHVSVSVPIF